MKGVQQTTIVLQWKRNFNFDTLKNKTKTILSKADYNTDYYIRIYETKKVFLCQVYK